MKTEDREALRKLAETTYPIHYGKLVIELLDETEERDSRWMVSHSGIVAHFVSPEKVPVCPYRDTGPWRVVPNATPCSACRIIVQEGLES